MPVMIIIFLASGIIFLRKYGKRKSKNVTKEQSLLSGMVDYFFQQKPELCGEQTRHEVHEEDVRPEMADSARYELEADGFLHEMQVEERRQELGAEVPCFELQKG